MRPPNLELIDLHPPPTDLRREVIEGLRKHPKSVPPKLFYDRRGSELFEQITELPEYYLTRTEISILERYAREIIRCLGERPCIIELGSGSSRKVRILLDGIIGDAAYVAIDISLEQLREAATKLAQDYPSIAVVAVCADYISGLELPELPHAGRRTVFFPGSNLGNLTAAEAMTFFKTVAAMLRRRGDGMLIGLDQKKDPAVLHAAYNDSRGVTAEFNLNILRRIKSELNAQIDVEAFEHVAFYDAEAGRIEMHLRARSPQTIVIGDERFDIAAGEMIHTENSHKYGEGDLERLIEGSGFVVHKSWHDPQRWFALHYLRVIG